LFATQRDSLAAIRVIYHPARRRRYHHSASRKSLGEPRVKAIGWATTVDKEIPMAKYLIEVNYSLDGIKGVKTEGGSARVAAATALIESLGGKVESFHFALGNTDAYVIVDMPDSVSIVAAALAVNAGGGATARTVSLITPGEVDAAVKVKSTYRPPGH
jgi:uncharacterized protein with GYD domain